MSNTKKLRQEIEKLNQQVDNLKFELEKEKGKYIGLLYAFQHQSGNLNALVHDGFRVSYKGKF